MHNELAKNLQGFLASPVESFRQVGAQSLGAAYRYYTMLLIIFSVLYGIVTLALGAFAFNGYVQEVSVIPVIGEILSSELAKFGTFVMVSQLFSVYTIFLALLFGIFLAGFIFHAFVILVDGKKGLVETIKTTMYAATPALLFGWIPFIGIIGAIWSFVLLILGFRENNGLSSDKAVLVAAVPVLLGLIMCIWGNLVISMFLDTLVSSLPVPVTG